MHGGNPTGAMGLCDYLGWDWKSKAGLPVVNVPGCPVQPDNMMETLLYLLYQVAGLAPIIPLDDQLRPPGCSVKPCTRDAIAPVIMNKPISRRNMAPPSAW
jgi:Ni,Fe-hydrogenase I small subunit